MMNEENEFCPIPAPLERGEADAVQRLVRGLPGYRIAVVGLSADPSRASHQVAEYLIAQGADVVPVNPGNAQILGRKCYPSLRDVPGRIDLVNVFRRPEHCPEVVRDAIAINAGAVWLQSGIRSDEAEQLANAAGVGFVQDRCLMVEHVRCKAATGGRAL